MNIKNLKDKFLDWEQLKERVEHLEELQESDDEKVRSLSNFLQFEEGKKLSLTVEVVDPTVANVILGMGMNESELSPVPGMKLLDVRFGDLDRKDLVIKFLREKADELEKELHQPPESMFYTEDE